MKKTILFAAILAAFAMVSCTKEQPADVAETQTPISLYGIAGDIDQTKAPINGTSMSGQTARVLGSATSGDFSTLYTSNSNSFNVLVTFDAEGKGTYNPAQYYPANGASVYVKGFVPASATVASNTVSFSITGAEDVLLSNELFGTKTTPVGKLTYGHLLSQLQFTVKGENSAAVSVWGDITKIEVLNQNSKFDVVLSGSVTSNSSTPTTMDVIGSVATLTTSSTAAGNVMVLPLSGISSSNPLKIKVYTTNVPAGQEISLDSIAGGATTAAGSAYTINLTFKATAIEISGQLTDWVANITPTDVNIL